MMTFYTAIQLINEFQLDYNRNTCTVSKIAADIIGTSANLVKGDQLTYK